MYYGYDDAAFYVAVQANEDLASKVNTDYSLSVLTGHKHITDPDAGLFEADPAHPFVPPGEAASSLDVARRVRLDFSGDAPVLRLEYSDGAGGWIEQPGHGAEVGGPQFGGMVVEFRIPWGDLGLAPVADPLRFHVVATEGGEAIDAAPSFAAKRVFDDVTNLVFVTFEVDTSGGQISIEPLGFVEPPPPLGSGTLFIVGKQDKIGGWIPNKTSLTYQSDGLWSATFGFPRGDVLQYKYTVGTSTFEGQWAGTEEFPFSNRQFIVPTDPAVGYVVIADVLGDDPPQENSLGKFTVVTEYEEAP